MWPFKNKPEKKSVVLGTTHALGSFMIFGHHTAATATSALVLYEKSTAVSIPINMIAEAFSSIEPVIKKQDDNFFITDHPILDLLRSPSAFFTKDSFFEAIGKHYLITGNSYIVALGNVERPPLELQPISPANANDVEGSQGMVDRFIISGNSMSGSYEKNNRNRMVRYIRDGFSELKQIRGFSVRNNSLLRGQSPLMSASAEVRQHILGNTHNVSLLERGGRTSLVFHFEEDLNPDDFEEIKDRIRSQYGGASKAGEIGVTSGGKLNIKELGINNKDMDFANLQMMAKQAVASQYKVPLTLISTDRATFSNLKDSRLALYDDAVLPLADKLFGGLTNLLMPRYKEDPAKLKITYDVDSITALSSRRNDELKLRRDLNLESLNEQRVSIGREPVQGGDQILSPATLVPIGTDLFTDDNEREDSEPDPDEEFSLLRDEG